MKEILRYLFDHRILSRAEACAVLLDMAAGRYTATEMTALISVYNMRPLSLPELQGFRQALLQLARPVELEGELLDLVGTGGDGKDTFNISTLSCLVVAGAGQKVAKHGNYGVSSISGSSNVLEELGYRFPTDPEGLQRHLDSGGICFLHAPLFHPAMAGVGPIRKELGVRTFFNLLGPLVNPVRPRHTVLGVYNLEVARLYHYLLQLEEDREYTVVHALDGYDEISLTGDAKILSKKGEQVVGAAELGFAPVKPEEITGGTTKKEAAQIFLNILKGEGSAAQNSVVVANAAVALHQTGAWGNYEECRARAAEALESGAAYQSLKKICE